MGLHRHSCPDLEQRDTDAVRAPLPLSPSGPLWDGLARPVLLVLNEVLCISGLWAAPRWICGVGISVETSMHSNYPRILISGNQPRKRQSYDRLPGGTFLGLQPANQLAGQRSHVGHLTQPPPRHTFLQLESASPGRGFQAFSKVRAFPRRPSPAERRALPPSCQAVILSVCACLFYYLQPRAPNSHSACA